eukprot:gene60525-80715_t
MTPGRDLAAKAGPDPARRRRGPRKPLFAVQRPRHAQAKGGPMTTHAIASPGRPRRSFADFYRSSAYSQFPQEHRTHLWSQFHGFVVDQQPHDFTDIASTDWVLGLPLKASCPTRFDYGEGWKQRPRSRGDFLLVPPGTEVRYEIAGPTRLLVLTWSGGLLTDLDDELFAHEEAALRPLI